MRYFVVLTLIALTSAAKQKEQRVQEYFSEFQNDEDIKLITDEDERPPTTFEGSAMTAKINSLKNSNQGRGKFNYNFETQNGISIASIGKLKDKKTFVVSGSYAYTGANGKRYRVRYTADEFGYHPFTELDTEIPIQVTTVRPVSNFNVQLGQTTPSPLSSRFGKQSNDAAKRNEASPLGRSAGGLIQSNGSKPTFTTKSPSAKLLADQKSNNKAKLTNGATTVEDQKSNNKAKLTNGATTAPVLNQFSNPFNQNKEVPSLQSFLERTNKGSPVELEGRFGGFPLGPTPGFSPGSPKGSSTPGSSRGSTPGSQQQPSTKYLPADRTYLPPVSRTYLPVSRAYLPAAEDRVPPTIDSFDLLPPHIAH